MRVQQDGSIGRHSITEPVRYNNCVVAKGRYCMPMKQSHLKNKLLFTQPESVNLLVSALETRANEQLG